MATSGTTTYTMTVDKLIDEAASECKGGPILVDEVRKARSALNHILIDWANKEIFLWKHVYTTVACSVGQATYALDADTQDVNAAVFARSSVDTPLERKSFVEYLNIPKKTQQGRPSTFFIDRQRVQPVLYLWPIPDTDGDQVVLSRTERLEDVTNSHEDVDIPFRYLPALKFALATHVCAKRHGWEHPATVRLEQKAADLFMSANENDRERTSLRIVPKIGRL